MAITALLQNLGVLTGVVVPPKVAALLDLLVPDQGPLPDSLPATGSCTLSAPLPLPLGASSRSDATLGWALAAEPGGAVLRLTPDLETQALPGITSATLTDAGTGAAARVTVTADPTPFTLGLKGTLALHLSPAGARIAIENLTFTPTSPAIRLAGDFALDLPASFSIVDDALAFTDARLVIPEIVPMLGGLPVATSITGPAGAQNLTLTVPPTGTDPKVSGSLTFALPAEFTFADLVPTSTDIALHLPSGGQPFGAGGPTIAQQVRIRAVITRPLEDPDNLTIAVTAESDGTEGLVHGGGPATSDIALGTTFVLGPAMAAELGAAGPAGLLALYGAASALASTLASHGDYTLHTISLQAAPSTGDVRVGVDISGAVAIKPMDLGLAKISMDPTRPLRIRWRGISATLHLAALTANPAPAPATALDIDFSTARCDVLDPGGWTVESDAIPHDLLQVVGTRSGNGSTWVEVDLRFAMDLGPVTISGAIVRGTWSGAGLPSFGIRGFEASLSLPGVVTGGGRFALDSSPGVEGIAVALWGTLIPLNIGGFIDFRLIRAAGTTQFYFGLGLDLPTPIPLGPTGLGIYSLAAGFGANAAMQPLDATDPLKSLRKWKPWDALDTVADQVTIGAGLVLGTVPDGGFAFNALGVLGITVPDFALRIGLSANVVSRRRSIADVRAGKTDDEPAGGLVLFGGLSASSSELLIGVEGRYTIPYVVDVRIPVAASFRFGDDSANWWLHAGSDGDQSPHHRPPGPMTATVFPGLGPLEAAGWAYLMIHGNGIPDVAGNSAVSPQGFAVAVGVGFSKTFGVKGVLWASVSASVIAALGTRPFMVYLEGRLAGEVGIGPFSLGVDATLKVLVGPDDRFDFEFRVCISIDLFFTELEGCIDLGSLDQTALPPVVPADDQWPWPDLTLADGLGHLTPASPPTAAGLPGPDGAPAPAAPARWSQVPTVWPDVIPLLTFPVAPISATGAAAVDGPAATHGGLTGAGRTRFRWTMTALSLQPVDVGGAATGPAIPLDPVAWQPAPGVSPTAAGLSTPRQLALLTRDTGLGFRHVGEATAADDPALQGAAGPCSFRFSAQPAWTYGAEARAAGSTSWHVSRRTGISILLGSWGGIGFTLGRPTPDHRPEPVDPAGAVIAAGGPFAFPSPLPVATPVDEETFAGALRARSATALPHVHEGARSRYRIDLDEPAATATWALLIRVLGTGADDGVRTVSRWIDAGWEGLGGAGVAEVSVEPAPDHDPAAALVCVSVPAGVGATAIWLSMTAAATVDVLGLYALSQADHDAAEAAEKARQQRIADTVAATATSQRTVLAAGTCYRIDVTLNWQRITDLGTGAPTTDPGSTRSASYFLRTAPVPPVVDPDPPRWQGASLTSPAKAQLTLDTFRPGYLERYLAGYTVAEREQYVFTTDRPGVQWYALQIEQLAGTYQRDLVLHLKRTDRATPARFRKVTIQAVIGPLSAPFADPVGQANARFGCPMPPREAKQTWPLTLEPGADYEFSVVLPRAGSSARASAPRLRPVTFSTSAFADPQALVESLGFTRSTSPAMIATATATGHLPVQPPVGILGVSRDDDELESAVATLGLPPLRTDGGPGRSSLLWARSGSGWVLQGLLLEAAEPLVRAGGARMDVTDASVGSTTLPIRRLDRSGTRALWLLASARQLKGPTTLRIRVLDRGTPYWMRLTVPPVPAFAGSPIMIGGNA